MRTIVVGYDGTSGADRALDRAAELARAFGARLILVTVAEPPQAVEPVVPIGMVAPVRGWWANDPSPEEIVERVLADARDRLSGLGVDVELEGRIGVPPDSILAVAEDEHADLIVVGTREPGFVTRLIEGSVSADVARRAHCDVLVVHPERDKRTEG